jgi:hypothetical protein
MHKTGPSVKMSKSKLVIYLANVDSVIVLMIVVALVTTSMQNSVLQVVNRMLTSFSNKPLNV